MNFIRLEYPNNPTNNSCSSQAVEIAIDAHATRLIQNNSSPEACVDSSLGPYITSILREALLTNNNPYTNNGATSTTVDETLSSLPEYESLIELLESQCMMELQVASHVIHEIARAITIGGRGEHIDNRSTLGYNDKNYDYYPCNNSGGGNSPTDKRLRSKSLGAEKELDVNFLGKILETMTTGQIVQDNVNVASFNTCSLGYTSLDYQAISTLPQSQFDDAAFPQHPPVTNVFVNENNNNNSSNSSSSALLSKDRQDRNQRHVSFDETYATPYDNNSPQCRGESYLGSTMLSSIDSSWQTDGHGVDEAQACLGASLGFLDLEEDEDDVPHEEKNPLTIEEENVQVKEATVETRRGSNNGSVVVANGGASTTSEVINSELAQCHPVSGFPDPAPSSDNSGDVTVTTTSVDKPPTNPKRGGASSKKRSSKKEAEELVAALFVTNSRPRSNSLPLQVVSSGGGGTPTTSYPYDKGAFSNKSSVSLAPTETSATTQSTDSAVIIESTTEILLTMNYHLGHEAASMASQLSHGDLNLAQYLIEAARSMTSGNGNTCSYNSYGQRRRTRICRHELQGTCYRHDCPYSHDIAGVTCLFWLKGRCHHTDGSSCRFMHGFAESLLEGVSEDYFKDGGETMTKEQEESYPQEQHAQENGRGYHQGLSVPTTTNLLQRNEWSGDGSSNQTSPMFGNNLWSITPSSLENR